MPDKRPAYVIAEVEVTDPAVFQDYVAKAGPTLAGYNARLIVRSKAHRKEGTAPVGDSSSRASLNNTLRRESAMRDKAKTLSSRSTASRTPSGGMAARPTVKSFPCGSALQTRGFSSSRASLNNTLRRESAMRDKAKIVLALLMGIAIGVAVIPALNAQTAARGTYVVAEMHVTDPAGFSEYMRREPASLAPFRGRVAARALPDMREGEPTEGNVTIYAFNTPEDANHWYNSPDYAKLIALRQQAATTRLYFLTGLVQ